MPNKCHPVLMRNALLMVEAMKQAGIEFIPVPVINAEHKDQLVDEVNRILGVLEIEATELENNHATTTNR